MFAVLVATFVALYPYLGAMGHCDVQGDECPYAMQSSHTTSAGFAATCLSAVITVSSIAMLALAADRGRRLAYNDIRPADIFLYLDTPPPRLSL